LNFESVVETIVNNIEYTNHTVTPSHREHIAGLVEIQRVHSATAVEHSGTGSKQSVAVEDFKLIGTSTTCDD